MLSPNWKIGLARFVTLATAVCIVSVSWHKMARNYEYYNLFVRYHLFIRSCTERRKGNFEECMADGAELRRAMANQHWDEWALFCVGGPILAAIIIYVAFVLLRLLKRRFLPASPPAKRKLSSDEQRTGQSDRLVRIRLRMLIGRELEDRGLALPAEIGTAIGMQPAEAFRLLQGHQWREGDVARLEALAARLGVQPPGS